jgi:hypothetical protein
MAAKVLPARTAFHVEGHIKQEVSGGIEMECPLGVIVEAPRFEVTRRSIHLGHVQGCDSLSISLCFGILKAAIARSRR